MTDTESQLRAALRVLLRAVSAYSAQHKVDRCYCPVCNITRAAMAEAAKLLGEEKPRG